MACPRGPGWLTSDGLASQLFVRRSDELVMTFIATQTDELMEELVE